MNNIEINKVLRNVRLYGGCFSCDMIPKPKRFPIAYVVNTDNSQKPGQHWIVILIDKYRKCEYFDSLGNEIFVPEIYSFINSNTKGISQQSHVQLQHNSSVACGVYCIKFIIARSKRVSFEEFINYFSSVGCRIENEFKLLLL